MSLARLKRHLPKVLSLFSLCCICFTYGLATARYQVFPYAILRDAHTAFAAIVEAAQAPPNGGLSTYQMHVLAPTARRLTVDDEASGHELILVSGGPGYLKNLCESGCLAWILDREGTVRHFWKYDPGHWSHLQQVTNIPGISGAAYPVGMHLYDDGSLLVTFHASNTFPFAVGIARIDVNSNLLWKRELLTHHWFTVASDGRIFVPALRIVESPIPIADTKAKIVSDGGKIYSDVILVLDPDGNVLDEIPMLEALFESGWAGLMTRPNSAIESADVPTDDPLHLNDVQLVGPDIARRHPWLSPEDMLVSFRNINAVGILDATSHRFKWMTAGATVGQHSPRFFEDGVLLLDNLGGDQQQGGTQLVLVDFQRGQPQTMFPRPGVAIPDRCRTLNSGHLDLHPDGQRVLMAVTRSSMVWEINLRSGEVLWEYIYVHPDEDGQRAGINTAMYVNTPTFLQGHPSP